MSTNIDNIRHTLKRSFIIGQRMKLPEISMKKGIIIYQSKYGATRKYVNWLHEMTGFDCVETPKAVLNEVAKYEIIILCGGIYASGIAGLSFLKKDNSKLKISK